MVKVSGGFILIIVWLGPSEHIKICLLYQSYAADEEASVYLGCPYYINKN